MVSDVHAALFMFVLLLSGCGGRDGLTMSQQSHYGVSGLNTANNPLVGVPPGSLSSADNCVIRRRGMIEPRPGFTLDHTVTLDEIWKLIAYAGSYFAVGNKTGAQKTRWANDTLTDAAFDKHFARGIEARKNLYLTTNDAVRKFTAANDATAELAGLQPPLLDNTAGTGSGSPLPLLANNSVAYRAVIKRTDPNAVVIRSAPSGRLLLTAGGSALAPTIRVTWSQVSEAAPIAGDVIELYRSFNSSAVDSSSVGIASDELFLAYSITLASADISTGYVDIVDRRPDSDLRLPLYSNSTQEGIARANARPPRARDLELFQGSLFAADLLYPQLIELQWQSSTSAVTGSATAIGSRVATADYNNGSADLLNVSPTTGLQVGMIYGPPAGWAGTAPVRITAISGSTVTLSVARTGSSLTGQTVVFYDAIKIVGSSTQYFPIHTVQALLESMAVGNSHSSGTLNLSASTDVVGTSVADTAHYSGSGGVYGATLLADIVLSRIRPTDAAFTIFATHGDQMTPPVPLITAGAGLSSTQDAFVNGITWSKQEEPEHFMDGQLRLVGNARSAIVRIVALRDALYIFKARGDTIYRLSGFGERSGWNVQRLDDSTYILHPEMICVLEDAIYAWTNTGMCRIDAGGQTMLSGPILNLVSDQELNLDSNATTHAYGYGIANLQDHEVIFGLPTDDTDGHGVGNTWVFNTLTDAWTAWFGVSPEVQPTAMLFNPATRLIMKAGISSIYSERAHVPLSYLVADDPPALTGTVTAVTGTSITISASAWQPAVGDMINTLTVFALVTAVTDSTHFTVNVPGITTGAASFYLGISSVIAWLPMAEPSGALVKRWQSIITHWDDVFGLNNWTQTIAGPRGNSVTLSYSRTYDRSSHARAESRALLPASVAMDSQLYPSITIRQADGRWRITGITENFEIATDRVSL